MTLSKHNLRLDDKRVIQKNHLLLDEDKDNLFEREMSLAKLVFPNPKDKMATFQNLIIREIVSFSNQEGKII